MLEDIIAIEIMIAGVATVIFALSYASFFRWRKRPAGRALLWFISSVAALFLLSVALHIFGPDYWGRDVFRIIVYTSLAVSAWWMIITLWRGWLRGESPTIQGKEPNRP